MEVISIKLALVVLQAVSECPRRRKAGILQDDSGFFYGKLDLGNIV